MMKMRTYVILFSIVFFSFVRLNAQNSENAVSYMNIISKEYKDIQKKMWDYTSTMAHSHSAKKADNKRINLLNTINSSRSTVLKMSSFNGDNCLKDSVVSFLTLTFHVLNNDFSKIIDMEEVAEQSYDHMEAYMIAQEKANDKLDEASERMDNQYSEFAKKHNITLIESKDDVSKKLEIASAALDYHNQIYLIFFKAYKQEMYLLDAVEKNDINAIEQNRNALSTISAEGLGKLTALGSYKGDNSINAACGRLLNFYKDEAENQITILSDFFITKNEYDEANTMFESKDRMALTSEEVQRYNNAVNKYNKSVAKFNSTNTALNNKRNTNLTNWNNSVASFMTRQVPQK